MKRALPIVIVLIAVTVVLIFLGVTFGRSSGTVGIASGSALPGFSANASTPEQALSNFLQDVQRRNWDRAFASVVRTSDAVNEQDFIQQWIGTNGGLRSFSSLEKYEARPLHATNSDSEMRVRMQWTTPAGPVGHDRDFKLTHHGDQWKEVWDESPRPNVIAHIVH